MYLVRVSFIIIAFILVSGCTSVSVQPVDSALKMKNVCIEDGSQMCFDGQMLGVIRDGFERHGMTTQVFTTGNMPAECDFNLSYMCERTWDLATYMKHAELRLYKGKNKIGYAEYHLIGGGGFSLMKWQSSKTKMDPVIDELLGGYPIINK